MTGAHVLVVEDEPDIREFLALALEKYGYRVTTAANGAVALSALARDPADVILLDMRMPVMDGWAFADAYRQTQAPHSPIIVLTAAENAALRAEQIHAEAYLAKPFDLDELLTVVARYAGR